MVYILQTGMGSQEMVSRFTLWLRKKRNSTRQDLTFGQKLQLARELQGKNVVIGGKLCPVTGLREDTAEVEVKVGEEAKVYNPVDLVVDQTS